MSPADRPLASLASVRSRPSRAHRRGSLALSLLLVVSSLAACIDRAERPGTASAGAPANAPTDSLEERPEGALAAPDVVFRTLSGERLTLADATGPTLVAFWSTSCTICLHEMPELVRLHDDYAPRGFELVAVAMPHDRPDTVLELAEARGWSFPVALDIDGTVLAAFEPVPGTPTSFLIDALGTVVERRVGPADTEALRVTLDGLLGEAEPGETGPGEAGPGETRSGEGRSGGERLGEKRSVGPGETSSGPAGTIRFGGIIAGEDPFRTRSRA